MVELGSSILRKKQHATILCWTSEVLFWHRDVKLRNPILPRRDYETTKERMFIETSAEQHAKPLCSLTTVLLSFHFTTPVSKTSLASSDLGQIGSKQEAQVRQTARLVFLQQGIFQIVNGRLLSSFVFAAFDFCI